MENREQLGDGVVADVRDERFIRNRELICRAQSGDESATEALIVENVALVKSIALKFRDRGTEFEDLMQIFPKIHELFS